MAAGLSIFFPSFRKMLHGSLIVLRLIRCIQTEASIMVVRNTRRRMSYQNAISVIMYLCASHVACSPVVQDRIDCSKKSSRDSRSFRIPYRILSYQQKIGMEDLVWGYCVNYRHLKKWRLVSRNYIGTNGIETMSS